MDKLVSCSTRQMRALILQKQKYLGIERMGMHSRASSEKKGDKQSKQFQPDKRVEKIDMKTIKTQDITIPIRIERGPTDILQALASTVGKDYTAPHYKYHDDPYLIPASNLSKRSYALSKEAGRKAARWARRQMPDLFYLKNADPPIMPYLPEPTVENAEEITEDTVLALVHLGLISEAAKAYEMLLAKGGKLSLDGKQSLLEAAAFNNGNDAPDEDWLEEKWYTSTQPMKERIKNTWNNEGLAEQLFKEMENPDGRAYSAMIQGTAKHYHVEKAYQLFDDAVKKGLQLDVESYNSVIGVVNFFREDAEMRLSLLEELLQQMAQHGVKPNIGTLNSTLETCALCGVSRLGKKMIPQVWSEFTALGIKPSLASYYFLLITYYRRGRPGQPNEALHIIMDDIDGKEFQVQDTRDVLFLSAAMETCCQHLQDLELADRIHRFALTGNNYQFMGDAMKESFYFRNFFNLRLNVEPFDEFFKFYDLVVPNVYTPELQLMENILQALELNQMPELLPRLWSDIVIFDQHRKENILTLFLQLMAKLIPTKETATSGELGQKLANIGWEIWNQLENQDMGRIQAIFWSGKMLGDLMTVFVKNGEMEKATAIMKKLLTPNQKILGVPSIESLRLFLDECIASKNPALALACVQYTQDAGFPEAAIFGEDVLLGLELDAVQRVKLNSIVGFNVEASASAKKVSQS